MTIVRMGLSPRADGLSRQAAQRHWGGEHARLFARVAGVLSYVQNHAILDHAGEPLLGDPGFDIHSEIEFADTAALEGAVQSAYFRDVILADEKLLLDASRRTFLMTRRARVVGSPQSDSTKLVLFLTRQEPAAIPPHFESQDAHCAVDYAVDGVGGASIRRIDLVLHRYFDTTGDALRWYERSFAAGAGAAAGGYMLHTAVLARELEVVRRAWLTGQACAGCGAGFHCGARANEQDCWCVSLPPLSATPGRGCLCRKCLEEELRLQAQRT